jgi:hypothetical protein
MDGISDRSAVEHINRSEIDAIKIGVVKCKQRMGKIVGNVRSDEEKTSDLSGAYTGDGWMSH